VTSGHKKTLFAQILPILNAKVLTAIGGTHVSKHIANWVKKANQNEEGAISADWVVITAAVAGLSLGVILSVSNGAKTYATFLNEDIEDIAYKVGAGEY
jgi:hypothetical protein